MAPAPTRQQWHSHLPGNSGTRTYPATWGSDLPGNSGTRTYPATVAFALTRQHGARIYSTWGSDLPGNVGARTYPATVALAPTRQHRSRGASPALPRQSYPARWCRGPSPHCSNTIYAHTPGTYPATVLSWSSACRVATTYPAACSFGNPKKPTRLTYPASALCHHRAYPHPETPHPVRTTSPVCLWKLASPEEPNGRGQVVAASLAVQSSQQRAYAQ
jgi:hypothetical protein